VPLPQNLSTRCSASHLRVHTGVVILGDLLFRTHELSNPYSPRIHPEDRISNLLNMTRLFGLYLLQTICGVALWKLAEILCSIRRIIPPYFTRGIVHTTASRITCSRNYCFKSYISNRHTFACLNIKLDWERGRSLSLWYRNNYHDAFSWWLA
jgi:hypothetical protein